MGTLYLMRHGKAKWAEPGKRDFDRKLEDRGVSDAKAIGRELKSRGIMPDKIICSTAARAQQTIEAVNCELGATDRVISTDDLYGTDAPGYLEIASGSGAANSIMLVGHNPMLEDLALALSQNGPAEHIDALNMGFRTAGCVAIEFDGAPAGFLGRTGKLAFYLTPADL
ncbi:MAG: histidine phosphatase family protein [Pseudomonadota bacterium]